jgi:hypothetical protein
LTYLVNLALLASKRIKDEERDTLWFGVLPMAAYAGFLVTGAARAIAPEYAPEIGGFASVCLGGAAQQLGDDADHRWPLETKKAARGGFLESSACLFEQGEVDHIEPTEDPVDDSPQDRVVVRIGDGDGERGTEAHAIFHAFRAVIVRSIHANRSFAL